jgi:cytochrome d ubiquinol oxidase subunit II
VTVDLSVIWAGVIAFAVLMYILCDGFDLGVGILFLFLRDAGDRRTAINSIAPFWDGNETWLVLGGVSLFCAFPLAYSIILPAVYLPLILMLFALIFRGAAFEFQAQGRRSRIFWGRAFGLGSMLATFAQGAVLGAFVHGFAVVDNDFAGGPFDWLTPFALVTGLALISGYALLGSAWLILRTQGELQEWSYAMARRSLATTGGFIILVSLWTPLYEPAIAERWFGWPRLLYLLPIPLITASLAALLWRALAVRNERRPFPLAIGLFLLAYAGLGISLWPYAVPRAITLQQAAADPSTQLFLLVGAAVLIPLVLGYSAFTYVVFRGKVRDEQFYHGPD